MPLLAALAAASTASVANATPHSAGSTPSPGLWLVADNGRIQSLGSAGRLVPSDIGWLRHNPVVAAASTPTGAGLWVAAEDGRVYSFGDAAPYSAFTRPHGSADAVAIAGTPDGRGYLLAFDDGQVQAYGDAVSLGSAWVPHGEQHEIVGIALTPTGRGYWLAAADGQVYAFGDARRLGSSTNGRFDSRIVAIAATPAGDGVWLAGSDGRIVSLGAAPVFTTARHRGGQADVAGIAPTPSGRGLWLADADGSLETVGDAPTLGRTIHGPGDVVAVASSSPTGTLTATVSDLPPSVAPDASVSGAGVAFDLPGTETLRVPAGTYDVAARAVHSGGTTYSPTIDGSPATIAPGGSASVTVDYLTAVPDTTKVVAAASVEAATGDPATGVTLTLDAATAPRIAVGDVLALGITDATPHGLLGKVTAISAAGGALTVVTTPATLDEAITSGELDVHSASAPTRRTQGLGPLLTDIDRQIDCGADAPVHVSGTVNVTPDVNVVAQWGGVAHPLRLDATATVGVTESATLSLSAQAAASCTLEPTPLLFTPLRYVIPVEVVGIPVIVDVEIQLELTGSGSISAAVETSVTQTLTAFVGARYHDGDFTPIEGHHSQFSIVRPAPVDSVELQAAVGPRISVLIDGIAGPEAYLHAGLDLSADPAAQSPTPWWTLAGTIDAGIDFRASFKLWKISFNFEANLQLLSVRLTLAQATQPPPPLVTADPQEALPGDSIAVSGRGFGRNETVTLAVAGGRTLGTATTNSQGAFTKTISVPNDAPGGLLTLVASGRRSGKTATVQLDIGVPSATLTVDPSFTSPGDTATVSGDGFVGDETVDLALDGTPLGSTTAGSTGSFTKDVTIPADTSEGDHTITAVGRRSGREGSGDVVVGAPPPADLSVDPSTALPGDAVTVTGNHFGAGEKVALTFDDGSSLAIVSADRRGGFTADVQVPADATGGDHSILATGQTHGQTAEAAVHVDLPPPPCDGGPAPNDSFASAITLDGSSGRICGTLVGAGVDPFELALDQTGSDQQQPPNWKPTRAVWFKWTAGVPPNGYDVADILLDSLGSPAPMSGNGSGSTPSAGPPWIIVWEASSTDPSQLVPIGIGWDGSADYTQSGARVHPGQTYWIEVGNIPGQTPDAGQFFLNWQETNED